MVAVFVVATVVLFILIDGALQWSRARKQKESAVSEPATEWQTALAPEAVTAPAGLFLDTGHTWLSLDSSGRSRVGLDAFAQRVIGRIDRVDLPAPGTRVSRGAKLFTITQGERKADIFSPVDGVVSAVNEAAGRDPALVKADPYQRGWLCAIEPSNLSLDLRDLMVAEESKGWLAKEIERFKQFFAAQAVQHLALGHVMQDGGEVTAGVLEALDDEAWRRFSTDFLGSGVACDT
jgi:glycine cleavage system H lipoate-binding protein